MADHLSAEKRSWNMSRIMRKDTKPEKIMRSLLHCMGYRFRLHRKDLPGTPDVVLPRHKTVIFINGCFWHQHPGCVRATKPKSNQDYWLPKLKRNVQRAEENEKKLKEMGWKIITVWECELKKKTAELTAERVFSELIKKTDL